MPSPCAWIGLREVSVHTVPGVIVAVAAQAAGAKSPRTRRVAAPRSGTSLRIAGDPSKIEENQCGGIANVTRTKPLVNLGTGRGKKIKERKALCARSNRSRSDQSGN